MQYFIHHAGQQLGPFTEAEVKAKLAAGALSPQDLVWWEGQADWVPLGQVSAFAAGTPAIPGMPSAPAVPAAAALMGAPTSKLAIWSLVCGCLSLLCGIFASIPAIILGHMSLSEIKKAPATQGKGMAIAGLILGYVFTTLIVIYLISIVVLLAMGSRVNDVFKTLDAQIKQSQAEQAAKDEDTNSDQAPASPASTNAPSDSTTNAPASGSDSSTNSSSDSNTNAPATN